MYMTMLMDVQLTVPGVHDELTPRQQDEQSTVSSSPSSQGWEGSILIPFPTALHHAILQLINNDALPYMNSLILSCGNAGHNLVDKTSLKAASFWVDSDVIETVSSILRFRWVGISGLCTGSGEGRGGSPL